MKEIKKDDLITLWKACENSPRAMLDVRTEKYSDTGLQETGRTLYLSQTRDFRQSMYSITISKNHQTLGHPTIHFYVGLPIGAKVSGLLCVFDIDHSEYEELQKVVIDTKTDHFIDTETDPLAGAYSIINGN